MSDKKNKDNVSDDLGAQVINITLEDIDSECECLHYDTSEVSYCRSGDESDSIVLCEDCKRITDLSQEDFEKDNVKPYRNLRKNMLERSSRVDFKNCKMLEKRMTISEERLGDKYDTQSIKDRELDFHESYDKDSNDYEVYYDISKYGTIPRKHSESFDSLPIYQSSEKITKDRIIDHDRKTERYHHSRERSDCKSSEYEREGVKYCGSPVYKPRLGRSNLSIDVRRPKTMEEKRHIYCKKNSRKNVMEYYEKTINDCKRKEERERFIETGANKSRNRNSKQNVMGYYEKTGVNKSHKRNSNQNLIPNLCTCTYKTHKRCNPQKISNSPDTHNSKFQSYRDTLEREIVENHGQNFKKPAGRKEKTKKESKTKREQGSCESIKKYKLEKEKIRINKSKLRGIRNSCPHGSDPRTPMHPRSSSHPHEQAPMDHSILMCSPVESDEKCIFSELSRSNSPCCQSQDRLKWSLCGNCNKRKGPRRTMKNKKEIQCKNYEPSNEISVEVQRSINERTKSTLSGSYRNSLYCNHSAHPESSLIMSRNFTNSQISELVEAKEIHQPDTFGHSKEKPIYSKMVENKLENCGTESIIHCESNCNRVKEICDRLKMVFESNMRKGFRSKLHNLHKNTPEETYQSVHELPRKLRVSVSQGCQTEFKCKCVQMVPKYNQVTQTSSNDLKLRKRKGTQKKFSYKWNGHKGSYRTLRTNEQGEDNQKPTKEPSLEKVMQNQEIVRSKRKHKTTIQYQDFNQTARKNTSLEKVVQKQEAVRSECDGKAKTKPKKENDVLNNNVQVPLENRDIVNNYNNYEYGEMKNQISEEVKWSPVKAIRDFDRAFQNIEKKLKTVEQNALKSPKEQKERASDKWRARIEKYSKDIKKSKPYLEFKIKNLSG